VAEDEAEAGDVLKEEFQMNWEQDAPGEDIMYLLPAGADPHDVVNVAE
jgi:hypothetical protein